MNLSSDKMVSKFAFKFNLYRYSSDLAFHNVTLSPVVGLYKLNPVDP